MSKGIILNDTELFISGEIGWDFKAEDFIQQINYIPKGETINVHIYSGGGNLLDALAIYDFVKLKGIKFNAYISGLSGSAATIIGAAAQNTFIGANSFYFVHRAFNANGNESEEITRMLDNANDRIIEIYKDLTGLSKPQIKKLLDAGDKGEFLTADQAIESGFVNSTFKEAQLAASAKTPFHKEVTKEEITNKLIINQKPEKMELNEKEVATSIFTEIKNLFVKESEDKKVVAPVAVDNTAAIKAAVAEAMAQATLENEALKATIAKNELEIQASVKSNEELATELAKSKATKTEVESKEDTTEANVVNDSLEYVNALKNIIKKYKPQN